MSRFGFIGQDYTSQSVNADAQRTINWYPEIVESGMGKSSLVLYPCPGLRPFARLSKDQGVRALFELDGRVFAINGSIFCEVYENGGFKEYGHVNSLSEPATMVANGDTRQLFIADGGNGFIFDLLGGDFYPIPIDPDLGFPGSAMGAFMDGYFIALKPGSQQFNLSGLNDGKTWDATDKGLANAGPGNMLAMIVDHRELWMLGSKHTQVFYDSGDGFPFQPVQNAIIEQGIIAPRSIVPFDNSLVWLGGDQRGNGIVWRANGYTPVRVSNHGIETAMAGYVSRGLGISDASAFSYQDQGHSFYVLNFPKANATWVLDANTGWWHQRGFWDTVNGEFLRAIPQCHAMAWGKHLVGSWRDSTIYEMGVGFADDDGQKIRRVRHTPHISQENNWLYHRRLRLDMETGTAPPSASPRRGRVSWAQLQIGSNSPTFEISSVTISDTCQNCDDI